uniref:MSP domain-containing protein n=1 Tax=Globodera pallida TaxID=36090 RepID=A0A183BWM5_GLOPA
MIWRVAKLTPHPTMSSRTNGGIPAMKGRPLKPRKNVPPPRDPKIYHGLSSHNILDNQSIGLSECELLREVDKRQNELLPQISLSKTEFRFGPVLFDQPSLAVLTITNTGQTRTHFSFKPAKPGVDKLEEWLTITPQSSFIDVGGSVEITLQILVFDESACSVPNDGSELSSIVIAPLGRGPDYFTYPLVCPWQSQWTFYFWPSTPNCSD